MKIYLDNCAINRPFDDQSKERIRLETEAVLLLLTRLTRGEWTWLGSQALEIEIERTPDAEQQARLQRIVDFVQLSVEIGQNELTRAGELERMGFVGFDAVHIACAESGHSNVFLTTDPNELPKPVFFELVDGPFHFELLFRFFECQLL